MRGVGIVGSGGGVWGVCLCGNFSGGGGGHCCECVGFLLGWVGVLCLCWDVLDGELEGL